MGKKIWARVVNTEASHIKKVENIIWLNNIESGSIFRKMKKKKTDKTFKRTTYGEKFIKIKKENSWKQGKNGSRNEYGRPKTD